MAYYPQSTSGLNYVTYPAGPTAAGATITAGGSAHAKGSYAQFVASTGFDANYCFVEVITCSQAGTLFLLDIATGAAASETVIIPNLLMDRVNGVSSHSGNGMFALPIAIPASTRVSARCQASTGSTTMEVAITLVAAGGAPGPTSYTNNGPNTGTTGGTNVDAGATINTKGAYAQLVASLAAVAQILCIQFTSRASNVSVSARFAVDVATGAAASEVVLIADLRFTSTEAISGIPPVPRSYTLLTYIAASTRVAVRTSSSTNDGNYRVFDCAIAWATAPTESAGGTGTSGSLARVFTGM